MFARAFLTRKSRLDCFPAAFSLAASCSLMTLLDFLPFLDSGSCSSAEVSVIYSELTLSLELVMEPSEIVAGSFLSIERAGSSF